MKQVSVGSATVSYDGTPDSRERIVAAIDDAGYTARPVTDVHQMAEAHERG